MHGTSVMNNKPSNGFTFSKTNPSKTETSPEMNAEIVPKNKMVLLIESDL